MRQIPKDEANSKIVDKIVVIDTHVFIRFKDDTYVALHYEGYDKETLVETHFCDNPDSISYLDYKWNLQYAGIITPAEYDRQRRVYEERKVEREVEAKRQQFNRLKQELGL